MPLKFVLAIAYLIIVVFLLLDHRRIHDKFATVEDFRNAIFNCVKSHEGLIFVATVFYVGCIIGTLLVVANA
jgi:hypothetical protein